MFETWAQIVAGLIVLAAAAMVVAFVLAIARPVDVGGEFRGADDET